MKINSINFTGTVYVNNKKMTTELKKIKNPMHRYITETSLTTLQSTLANESPNNAQYLINLNVQNEKTQDSSKKQKVNIDIEEFDNEEYKKYHKSIPLLDSDDYKIPLFPSTLRTEITKIGHLITKKFFLLENKKKIEDSIEANNLILMDTKSDIEKQIKKLPNKFRKANIEISTQENPDKDNLRKMRKKYSSSDDNIIISI